MKIRKCVKLKQNQRIADIKDRRKTKQTVLSMFAGVGGICLGFTSVNEEDESKPNKYKAKIVWANEVDGYACQTYRENFGDSYLVEGDITTINAKRILKNSRKRVRLDVLNGGFPCQAFSIAGEQKGFEHDQGNLFFDVVRLIKALKPKAILLENVKNLKSHDKGRTFTIMMKELRKAGYFVDVKVLNTMEYGGVPQNRERIFIVGFRRAVDLKRFSYPDSISLQKKIVDIVNVKEEQPKKYYYTKEKYPKYFNELGIRETITSQETVYQIRRGMYVRENKNNVCPTLTANMGTGGHNVPLILADEGRIRKLTPKECFGFQGFPEKFRIPKEMSDARAYKQAGNSVSVPVIRRIAKNMIEVLNKN